MMVGVELGVKVLVGKELGLTVIAVSLVRGEFCTPHADRMSNKNESFMRFLGAISRIVPEQENGS
jgi:hypothetical protein